MVRNHVRTIVAEKAILGRALIVVFALTGVMIAFSSAGALEGAGDLAVATAGLFTVFVFFGSLYLLWVVATECLSDLREQRHRDAASS